LRDINLELGSVVRCPECGDRIPSSQVMIQRHFVDKHKIVDQLKKREKGWRFQEVRQIRNPLSLKNIFGRA